MNSLVIIFLFVFQEFNFTNTSIALVILSRNKVSHVYEKETTHHFMEGSVFTSVTSQCMFVT